VGSCRQLIEGFEEEDRRLGKAGDVVRIASPEALGNAVADLLAVTPRTLQRRLTDEETSFRELLNALRLKLAKKYLKQAEYSLEDITFLLGFKDVGVFYRSFKSWTDQTPGEYRAMVQG
ncbi:MAG: helix-turn-helix domain-containing protein, partial [Thalassolituus sp.]